MLKKQTIWVHINARRLLSIIASLSLSIFISSSSSPFFFLVGTGGLAALCSGTIVCVQESQLFVVHCCDISVSFLVEDVPQINFPQFLKSLAQTWAFVLAIIAAV